MRVAHVPVHVVLVHKRARTPGAAVRSLPGMAPHVAQDVSLAFRAITAAAALVSPGAHVQSTLSRRRLDVAQRVCKAADRQDTARLDMGDQLYTSNSS